MTQPQVCGNRNGEWRSCFGILLQEILQPSEYHWSGLDICNATQDTALETCAWPHLAADLQDSCSVAKKETQTSLSLREKVRMISVSFATTCTWLRRSFLVISTSQTFLCGIFPVLVMVEG